MAQRAEPDASAERRALGAPDGPEHRAASAHAASAQTHANGERGSAAQPPGNGLAAEAHANGDADSAPLVFSPRHTQRTLDAGAQQQ